MVVGIKVRYTKRIRALPTSKTNATILACILLEYWVGS